MKITRRDFGAFLAGGTVSMFGITHFIQRLTDMEIPKMKRTDNSKAIIFLHIPKTGGSSLRDHVEKNVIASKLLMPGDTDAYRKVRQNYDRIVNYYDVVYLRGHFSMNIKQFLNEHRKHTECITILRKPTGRIPSSYRYQMKHWATEGSYIEQLKNEKLENYVQLIDFIKEEAETSWLSQPQFHLELNDGMTRRLSGTGTSIPFGKVTEETFETAKRNLKQRFTTIGLTEEYNKFLFMLANKYNWKIDIRVRKNRTKRKPLSDAEKEAILSINRYDARLYEYAKTLSHEMFQAMGDDVMERYEKFIMPKC